MPTSYTHHYIASKALATLPSATKQIISLYLPLYFFGAQGADFCFFYAYLPRKKKNLGSYLHRQGGYPTFCVLKSLAARDLKMLAYTLGYATHYAADVTFHPHVYARAGTSLWKHARIESALDERIKAFPLNEKHVQLWGKGLTAEDEAVLFTAYSAIAVKCGFPALEKPAFLRAIERFNTYPHIPSVLPFSQKYMMQIYYLYLQ